MIQRQLRLILWFTSAQVVFLGTLFGNDILLDRFTEEAPKAWRNYLHSLNGLEWHVTEMLNETGQTQGARRFRSGLYIYPNFLSQSTDERAVHLNVANAKYSFSLTKNGQGDTWRLLKVDPLAPPTPIRELLFPALKSLESVPREQELREWNLANLAVALKLNLRIWLPPYLDSPEFRILSVTEESDGKHNLVCVKYTYEPPRYTSGELLRSGEVFLMPDKFWALKKAIYSGLEPDQVTRLKCELNLEYDLESVDVPLPIEAVLKATSPVSPKDDFMITWNYQWNRNIQDRATQQFTLSHYGFPEPDFGERRTNRFRYILMTIGSLMIIIALWQMYRKRKENKA